jgi:hypothetical protein
VLSRPWRALQSVSMHIPRTRAILLLVLALLLWSAPRSASAQGTVCKNDFGLGPEVGFAPSVSGWWTLAPTTAAPSGRHGRFLGEFGGQTVSLHKTNLPPHREVIVSFDLFILKSWDGNQVPEVELRALLVRIGGEIYAVGTAVNRGSTEAIVSLHSATLTLFNPLQFHPTLESLPPPASSSGAAARRSIPRRRSRATSAI